MKGYLPPACYIDGARSEGVDYTAYGVPLCQSCARGYGIALGVVRAPEPTPLYMLRDEDIFGPPTFDLSDAFGGVP